MIYVRTHFLQQIMSYHLPDCILTADFPIQSIVEEVLRVRPPSWIQIFFNKFLVIIALHFFVI